METISLAYDEVPYVESVARNLVNVLNGISWLCQNGGYKEGSRNTIAVNLTVAASMLGLDALDVLQKFMEQGLILEENDDEYPWDRVNRVLHYDSDFSWHWMIDPKSFSDTGSERKNELKKLKFEIA